MDLDLEIHPSDINSALLCELRLDETLAEDEPNRDMMRGSVTHHLIERELLGIEMGPSEFIEDRLREEYGYADFDDAGIPMQQWDMIIGQSMTALNAWRTDVHPRLNTDIFMSVEEERRTHLDSRAFGEHMYHVYLVGSPDLVSGSDTNGTLRIHDWKTAARMWEPIKVTGQAQPPLYSALVRGAPVPFTFWIWDLGNEKWEFLSVTPTQAQMDEMIQTAVRVAIKREMGLLTATPGVPGFGRTRGWWCSPKYCHNWNKCTARHMTNDGNEDTKRDWRDDWQ